MLVYAVLHKRRARKSEEAFTALSLCKNNVVFRKAIVIHRNDRVILLEPQYHGLGALDIASVKAAYLVGLFGGGIVNIISIREYDLVDVRKNRSLGACRASYSAELIARKHVDIMVVDIHDSLAVKLCEIIGKEIFLANLGPRQHTAEIYKVFVGSVGCIDGCGAVYRLVKIRRLGYTALYIFPLGKDMRSVKDLDSKVVNRNKEEGKLDLKIIFEGYLTVESVMTVKIKLDLRLRIGSKRIVLNVNRSRKIAFYISRIEIKTDYRNGFIALDDLKRCGKTNAVKANVKLARKVDLGYVRGHRSIEIRNEYSLTISDKLKTCGVVGYDHVIKMH